MYEPRCRKPLVARASEDERKDLLPTLALLGARRISARRLTWFAFVPTDFRGNARLLAVEVHIVCTYKGVEMHDGTRRCSRRATHAGTDFHSSTSKDILLLIKTVTKFSNVIGNHQPDLSSNRTVCAKSKLSTLECFWSVKVCRLRWFAVCRHWQESPSESWTLLYLLWYRSGHGRNWL